MARVIDASSIVYCYILCISAMSSSSDDDESDEDESEYIFSTPEGHNLARRVLRPQVPYDPHDAQLEGICKAIDGVDIMVLTPTGSGKTGYFTMYMLLMLSLAAKPELIQPSMKKVPPNPVMVIVFPTNGVEEEMVRRNQPIVTEAAILI